MFRNHGSRLVASLSASSLAMMQYLATVLFYLGDDAVAWIISVIATVSGCNGIIVFKTLSSLVVFIELFASCLVDLPILLLLNWMGRSFDVGVLSRRRFPSAGFAGHLPWVRTHGIVAPDSAGSLVFVTTSPFASRFRRPVAISIFILV